MSKSQNKTKSVKQTVHTCCRTLSFSSSSTSLLPQGAIFHGKKSKSIICISSTVATTQVQQPHSCSYLETNHPAFHIKVHIYIYNKNTPELCIYIENIISFIIQFTKQLSSPSKPCPQLPKGVKHHVTYPHLLKIIQQHSAFPLVFSSLGELSVCRTVSVILNHRQAAFQTHHIGMENAA